jgi:hypothetical protein
MIALDDIVVQVFNDIGGSRVSCTGNCWTCP